MTTGPGAGSLPRVQGKIVVVTGANSGIGKAMARDLAGRGARVVMVCRNPEKGEEARREIVESSGNEEVSLELADLGDMDQVRSVAERLRALPRIDALMNNAGLYLPDRQISPDGFEMMFAVNHLAPFLLTHLLRDTLAKTDAPRVVTTSSIGHRFCKFDIDRLQAEHRFIPLEQYGLTKLANIFFTKEAARRYEGGGLNCFHPGAVGTGFAQDEPGFFNALMKVGKIFIRSPEKGAETGIYLATSDAVEGVTGEYFVDRKKRKPSRTARDPELARALWERSAEMVGI